MTSQNISLCLYSQHSEAEAGGFQVLGLNRLQLSPYLTNNDGDDDNNSNDIK